MHIYISRYRNMSTFQDIQEMSISNVLANKSREANKMVLVSNLMLLSQFQFMIYPRAGH